ncbi:tellurite resistance methyltransferase TehB [Winslowiella iniecta]|nr:tellurite resistance methyltransferase TehB [Winslowiella iniecta]
MTTPDTRNDLSKKYALSAPHSEIVEAASRIAPGKALDLGCGNGRNSLWLNQRGFELTAWDKNPQSIATLNHIIEQESLSHISTEIKDLDSLRFNGQYQLVFSTVVMMFLQPDTIPQMIADMQASTVKNGYNLIVAAMDTADYPCTLPFPFTFKSGELSHYYRKWHIVKYNEEVGQLFKTDENGNRIQLRFATLLAQKAPTKN